ncbi:MAG: hypothetical protein QM817_34420 [Archangium sp.]
MSAIWEVNSSYVRSLTRAMSRLGKGATALSVATQSMVDRPDDQTWWPGTNLIELLQALEREHGRAVVDTLSIRASHDGMGVLVRPLVSVVLTFSRSRGVALFSRVDTFTAVGVRGVKAVFAQQGDGGEVTFTFPTVVPEIVSSVWTGMMDVGFSLARGGRCVSTDLLPLQHKYRIEFGAA